MSPRSFLVFFQLSICLFRLFLIYIFEGMILHLIRRTHSRSFVKKFNREHSFFQRLTKFCYWNMARTTLDKIFLRCLIIYRFFILIAEGVAFATAFLFLLIEPNEKYLLYCLFGLGVEAFAMIFAEIYQLVYRMNEPRKMWSKKDGIVVIAALIFLGILAVISICVTYGN